MMEVYAGYLYQTDYNDGGGIGKSGSGTLSVDGKQVAQGRNAITM